MTRPMTRPGLGVEMILLLVGWHLLVNLAGRDEYAAPSSFYYTVMMILLTLAAPHLARLVRRVRPLARLSPWTLAPLLGCLITFGYLQAFTFNEQIRSPKNEHSLVDIGQNTYEAGKMFFTGGVNPYAHRAQIWHTLEEGEKITRVQGQTHLFGMVYNYGYPYFPWMFFSYAGFRRLVDNYNAVRVANLVFLALNILGICLVASRLARDGDRKVAMLGAAALFICFHKLDFQLFEYGVTDIVIGVYLLFGIYALQRQRDATAGVLLGMAQACKLFPGAVLLPVTFFWYRDGRRRLRFMVACIGFLAALVGPFFLWDPESFFSATILFYLAHHGDGDDTAAYHILPERWKGAFTLVRWPLMVWVIYRGLRHGRGEIRWLLVVSSLAYLIFLAFNQMLHLNYYWPIYGISCLALVAQALPGEEEADPRQLWLPGIPRRVIGGQGRR